MHIPHKFGIVLNTRPLFTSAFVFQPVQHQVVADEPEYEENHRQRNKHVHIVCFMHMHRLHEFVRQHEMAVHFITGHSRPPVAKQGKRRPLQRVLEEGDVEQPVHKLVGLKINKKKIYYNLHNIKK